MSDSCTTSSLSGVFEITRSRNSGLTTPSYITFGHWFESLCVQLVLSSLCVQLVRLKVDPLPGAVPKLRRVVRLHNSIPLGESGETLGHWFESLCVQFSVKVLISAFAPGNMGYLRASHQFANLRYQRDFRLPFCTLR